MDLAFAGALTIFWHQVVRRGAHADAAAPHA
jgi:hypothetical protein